MAKTVIQVDKKPNENNASLLRRFSRREKETGVKEKAKGSLYNERKESKLKAKKSALKRMEKRSQIERLRKLGKIR